MSRPLIAANKQTMTGGEESHGWWRTAKGCGALLIIFVLLPFIALKACAASDAHPTDRAMVEEFRANRKAFSNLLRMVREERRVTRIADDFIWIDGATNVPDDERSSYLSDARLARYRSSFRELKLESGVIRYEDGSVGFLRSSSGMVLSGSGKEFIWSQNMDDAFLTPSDPRSLEDACIARSNCHSTRRIAPQWFISFERN